MPYQLFYGNPYAGNLGQALFQGSQSQVNFARLMQNNEIKLKQRQLDQVDAQRQMQWSIAAMENNFRNTQLNQTNRLAQQQLGIEQQKWNDQLPLLQDANQRAWDSQNATIDLAQSADARAWQGQDAQIALSQSADSRAWQGQDATIQELIRKERNALADLGAQAQPGEGLVPYQTGDGKTVYLQPETQRTLQKELFKEQVKLAANPGKFNDIDNRWMDTIKENIDSDMKFADLGIKNADKIFNSDEYKNAQMTVAKYDTTAPLEPASAKKLAKAKAYLATADKQAGKEDIDAVRTRVEASKLVQEHADNEATRKNITAETVRDIEWKGMPKEGMGAWSALLGDTDQKRQGKMLAGFKLSAEALGSTDEDEREKGLLGLGLILSMYGAK